MAVTPPTTPELLARPTKAAPSGTFATSWTDASPAADKTYDLRGGVFSGFMSCDALFGYAAYQTTPATAHERNATPVKIGDSAPATCAAVIGGKSTGDQPRTLSWEEMKHGSPVQDAIDAGMAPAQAHTLYVPNNQNQDGDGLRLRVTTGSWVVVDGFRADNTMDGIGLYSTHDALTDTGDVFIRNCWIRYNHDDAIENDRAYLTLHIDDSLFEQVHAFISHRANVTTGTPDPAKTATVRNSIVWLHPKPGPHNRPRSFLGSGNLYKRQTNSPPLVMENVIVAASKPADPASQMDLPTGSGCAYRNVTIVWLGSGAYPGNIPPGCTLTTDRRVLDDAVATWKARHGVTDFDTVDQARMIDPLPSTPVDPGTGAIRLGAQAVTMRLGSAPVDRAYLGATQIYPPTSPPPPPPPPTGDPLTVVFFSDTHVGGTNTAHNKENRAAVAGLGADLWCFAGDMNGADVAAFDGIYGDVATKIRPSTGSHDLETSGSLAAFVNYFTGKGLDLSPLWYSFDTTNGWHGICLTTNGTDTPTAGTAQYNWLVDDLAANRAKPTFIYHHTPRWNIGSRHSQATALSAVWSLFAANPQVEFVVSGHEHLYQRFYRQTSGGVRDDVKGVVQFVCPAAGGASEVGSATPRATCAAYANADHITWGYLVVRLYADRYESRLYTGATSPALGSSIGADASSWISQRIRVTP